MEEISENKRNLYNMLHRFRDWNREWDLVIHHFPEDVDGFVSFLDKQYNVTIK
jgi:hypothetical protein